ncbi:YSC84-related protein [Haloferula sp.]|uniref:lipid-binding SYLF domain-containing protein n=1 Tax=Haloferula sp. TaxID=2497595 RepID=UPI00329D5EC3
MNNTIIPNLFRPRRVSTLLLGAMALVATSTAGFAAKTAEEVEASVNAAIKRFHASVDGSEEVIKNAKGILIMPNVKKGGFVVGGEFGRGALRVDGKTVTYYKMAAASVGLVAGVESKDILLAFMTDEALKKFQDSKGWEAGVDGSIAIWKKGAGDRTSIGKSKEPILGFIFGNKGLMGDLSLSGSKITSFVPKD